MRVKVVRQLFSTMRDPWKVLGVKKGASEAEIKAAYYKLAKQYHPDIKAEYAQKFKEINQAYAEARNPQKHPSSDQGGERGHSADDDYFNAWQRQYEREYEQHMRQQQRQQQQEQQRYNRYQEQFWQQQQRRPPFEDQRRNPYEQGYYEQNQHEDRFYNPRRDGWRHPFEDAFQEQMRQQQAFDRHQERQRMKQRIYEQKLREQYEKLNRAKYRPRFWFMGSNFEINLIILLTLIFMAQAFARVRQINELEKQRYGPLLPPLEDQYYRQ